jgi:hypothetical protein
MPRIFGAAGEAGVKSAAPLARAAGPRRQLRRDGFTC